MEPTKTMTEICQMLLSEDPAEHMKGEYFEIEYEFVKLNEMLMMWDLGRLDPIPKGNRYQYGELLGNLRAALGNLKILAKAEGIDLKDSEESQDEPAE